MATIDWKDPDYTQVYKERSARLRAFRKLPRERQAMVHDYYAQNPIDWIEDWAHTFDPRDLESGKPALRPFLLMDRQRDLINFWHGCNKERADGVVEKTREVGVSWCAVAYGVWMWLYRPGAVIGFGSYSMDRVDVLGVSDSLLEKCRIVIRNLPPEMQPAGLNTDKSGHLLKNHLLNPVTGAQIIGEVGSEKIGRGGKASIYFIDEYAFLKNHELVDSSLANCSNCKIFISTAYGTGAFYQKTLSKAFRQFRFEWRQDPRKDEAWYQAYREKWGETITAREVDIDHLASIEDLVIEAKWVEAAINLRSALIGAGYTLPVRPDLGVAGLDVGGGVAPSVFTARFGPYIDPPIGWLDKDQGTVTGVRALAHARRHRTNILHYDAPGVGDNVNTALRMSPQEARILDPVAKTPWQPPADESPIQTAARSIDALFEQHNDDVVLLSDIDEAIPGADMVVARGVNTGESAADWVQWPDGRTSKQMHHNLRAEIWWTMRSALTKSYEMWLYVTGKENGAKHDLEECMFLPECNELRKELCAPTWHKKQTGKIGIELKEHMKERGVPSPDYADSLALTYVPIPQGAETRDAQGYF